MISRKRLEDLESKTASRRRMAGRLKRQLLNMGDDVSLHSKASACCKGLHACGIEEASLMKRNEGCHREVR